MEEQKVTLEFLEFMKKLELKLKWVKSEKELCLTSSEGIELILSIEVRAKDRYLPLQVVAKLFMNDVFLTTWGCESNADNAYILNWYGAMRSVIKGAEHNAQRNVEIQTLKKFKEIF